MKDPVFLILLYSSIKKKKMRGSEEEHGNCRQSFINQSKSIYIVKCQTIHTAVHTAIQTTIHTATHTLPVTAEVVVVVATVNNPAAMVLATAEGLICTDKAVRTVTHTAVAQGDAVNSRRMPLATATAALIPTVKAHTVKALVHMDRVLTATLTVAAPADIAKALTAKVGEGDIATHRHLGARLQTFCALRSEMLRSIRT